MNADQLVDAISRHREQEQAFMDAVDNVRGILGELGEVAERYRAAVDLLYNIENPIPNYMDLLPELKGIDWKAFVEGWDVIEDTSGNAAYLEDIGETYDAALSLNPVDIEDATQRLTLRLALVRGMASELKDVAGSGAGARNPF